jgi:SAM-dependent methyltransferase
MEFSNSYEDERRAEAYAKLEFPGTYYLAYRDIPEIISRHTAGKRALDFGCGTGRSTRFLKKHGYEAVGVDISSEMLAKAREFDPGGDYRLVGDGGLKKLPQHSFDVVLSMFTFDNIPTVEKRVSLFRELGNLLSSAGVIVCLDSTPELYINEWASFSTSSFDENRTAAIGGIVRTIMKDVEDKRPVEDTYWTYGDYYEQFRKAGLKLMAMYKPLALESEPFDWVNETRIAPWVVFVLKKSDDPSTSSG